MNSHYHALHGDENWEALPREEEAEPQSMLSQAPAWERENFCHSSTPALA
ncbi:hypothetical protein [Chlorogloeopsis fritschii]|nr:hypothetical protein [Chlorogloeopsis fritschii]